MIPIFDSIKKLLCTRWYDIMKLDWQKRQPVRTAYLHKGVDRHSVPKFGESFANLKCKMMTGTIWTNKLKKRLAMQENDACEVCASVGISVVEDAEHVLGNCLDTKLRHDKIWKEIKDIGHKHSLHTESWTPWFNTSTFKHNAHNFPLAIGDKGLTPSSLRTLITTDNAHIPKPKLNIITNEIIDFWRWAKKDAFINRMKDVTAGRDEASLQQHPAPQVS